MKADMHNHTIYSDGTLNPIELSKYAKSKGLNLIAITDHDSICAFTEDLSIAEIPIIKGVELSTYYNGENIHLLGYFINNKTTIEIEELLKYFEEKRKERVYEIIKKLKIHYNIDIEYESIKKYADGAIGRVHIAKAVGEKYKMPYKEVFERYIGDNQLAYVPTENFDFKDAIDVLHRNNAIAVLAHPVYIKKNNIEELIQLGIDGIEAHYPANTTEDENYYLELANKYNLIITGGSDFHTLPQKEGDGDIGLSTIQSEELKVLLKKLNINIKE